jgi:TIGR03009 family protein
MPLVFVSLIALSASPDLVLDAYLAKWEKATEKVTSFAAEFEMTRTDAVFKKQRKYTGSVLLMKPNLFRISFRSASDSKDFEAFIFDGKSLFCYNWETKEVIEIPARQDDDSVSVELFPCIRFTMPQFPMSDLFLAFKAGNATKRFQFELLKKDDKNYAYLDIKSKSQKDKNQFEVIHLALFGPAIQPPLIPYLPAMVLLKKPGGYIEKWQFSNQIQNIKIDGKEIGSQHLQYEKPKGDNWKIRKLPIHPSTPKSSIPKK